MTGSTPQDDAAFKKLLQEDPECKKCFECGYPYPQWCSYTHGIMMCLECSGKHRGLGTHLVQVRSSTMDGWSNWKPEKLQQMVLGGNRKARIFFEQHGVDKCKTLKEKYEHPKAQMYRARLEAMGLGQPFDEASFVAQNYSSPPPAMSGSRSPAAGAGGNRFQGMGSQSGSPAQGGDNEWLSALSSGWNSVAAGASAAGKAVGQTATKAGKAMGETATNVSRSVESGDIGAKVSSTANEVGDSVSKGASKAWGYMAWATTALASNVKQAVGDVTGGSGDGAEEDGLGALTRGVERTQISSETEKSKFGHVEHQASPSSGDDGLRGLTSGLQRTGKCQYEGIGSSPPPLSSAGRQGSNTTGSRNNSNDDFMSALGGGGSPAAAASPAPVARKQPSPVQRSPVQASPVQQQQRPAVTTPQQPPAKKPAATANDDDDDWNTDW